jgi:hypothetical protein
MNSDKKLKISKKMVSFLEKSLDKEKPIYDNRIYDKIGLNMENLVLNCEIKKAIELKDKYITYLVKLYESGKVYNNQKIQ